MFTLKSVSECFGDKMSAAESIEIEIGEWTVFFGSGCDSDCDLISDRKEIDDLRFKGSMGWNHKMSNDQSRRNRNSERRKNAAK